MTDYSFREFERILARNGYLLVRTRGSHHIYKNKGGDQIVAPYNLKAVICNKLIREKKLVIR